ncbi:MAG: tetratricopeptide repeat protein [Isosphaeraceae bacterium]
MSSWLADEPVTARRDPPTELARRWARKHRTLTTAAALAGVLLTGSLAIGYWRETVYADNLRLQRERAEYQRERAEVGEKLAIEAVSRFGEVISEEPLLKDAEELRDLRTRLLKEPQAFFRALRDRLQANPDAQLESLVSLAVATFGLGHLTAEIGDETDAITELKHSEVLWRKLANDQPDVAKYLSNLAATHGKLASLLSDTGDSAGARRAYESALAIRKKLAEDHPAVTEFQADLAGIHNNLALLLGATGDPAGARREIESALAIQEKLAEDHPAVTRFQSELATSHNNLCILLSDTGDPAGARREIESALAIQEKLAEDHPAVAQYQSDLAGSHNNLGKLLSDTGDLAGARRAHESALAIGRKLADDHPAVARYQNELAKSYKNLGNLFRVNGDPAAACRAYQSALAIRRELADNHPSVTQYQSHLAASQNDLGALLNDTGDPAGARRGYESALAIQTKLADGHFTIPEYQSNLGVTLHNLALVDLCEERFAEARDRLREAISRQKNALEMNPRNSTYRQYLTDHYNNLREVALSLADADLAAEVDRGLVELAASDPVSKALDARLAVVLKGEAPKDIAERLMLARRAFDTQNYAFATKLWAELIEADPKAAYQKRLRYHAACAAALAAAGQGIDDPPPDAEAKLTLRRQALGWLKTELAAGALYAQIGPPKARTSVRQTLGRWKQDVGLSSVRDEDAIGALPEVEREPWRKLWADVDALLARAREEVSP